MKKIFLIVLIAVFTLTIQSCKKDSEEKVSDYMGDWSGTYSGDDEGTWKVLVDKDGGVTGSMTSDNIPITIDFEGKVDETGKVLVTFENALGDGSMTGQMTDGKVTGTWSNDTQNIGGIIEGKKD